MGVSGTKKNRMEGIKMEQSIKISTHILPFGQMKLNYTPGGKKIEEKRQPPAYIEPSTTNIEKIEVLFGEKGAYKVPETTGGVD